MICDPYACRDNGARLPFLQGKWGNFVIPASLVFFVDRLSKLLAIQHLFLGEPVKVVPGVFHLTLVFNKGAAFGIFKGQRFIFIGISIAIMALIIRYVSRMRRADRFFIIALGLIAGGAAGNLIDRIWIGYVIDFFDFQIWPVFNIADACLTIGTTYLVIMYMFSGRRR